MMNGAALSSYGYDHRMASKRRRVESSDEDWNNNSNNHHHQQQRQLDVYGGGHAAAAATASSTLTEDPAPSSQWHLSPYPDLSSYSHQPYFFQQTDPNTYNSPWPPPDTTSFAAPANTYNTTAPTTTTMPFFPSTHQTVHADSAYNVSQQQQSYQGYRHDVETSQPFNFMQVGSQHKGDMPSRSSSSFLNEDASMQMKIQSLPILENLATQLIHTIAKASYPQIQEIVRGNENEDSQAYTTVKNLFDQTRKVYSRETPFIDAIAIQMFQPTQQEIIRKANIATFISSILGAHDVSFFHLNEFFLETFVPLSHRLLKWQGAMLLDLKTQTYISALMNSDGRPEAMLDELFPSDLDAQILSRHPDAPSLSPSEQDFLDRSRARKSYLLAEDCSEAAARELQRKYQWQDFVRQFAACIGKNVEGIMNVPTRSSQPATVDRRPAGKSLQETLGQHTNGGSTTTTTAAAPLTGVQTLSLTTEPAPAGPEPTNTKKPPTLASTIRQPWTKPEEDALLSGLDQVHGPHWSQILALYGRGGSVSEVLKDRNQVQLKDKARNLKLWYLKMGREVPGPLRGVTGELRKRGGARARAALGLEGEEEGVESGEGGGEF